MPNRESSTKLEISLQEARQIRRRFKQISVATVMTVAVGAFAMHHLEDLSWLDAVYFSVVSLTTVGYGDFSPQTDWGKVFIMVYLLVGIAIVAALVNIILRNALASRVIRRSKADD